MHAERVHIELSPRQIARVIDAAAADGSLPVLLSGLVPAREVFADRLRELDARGLSRSLLTGLLVLACFPDDGGEMGVAEVARLVGMNTSTTHRYVSTLAAVGLVERDPVTRRYRLA